MKKILAICLFVFILFTAKSVYAWNWSLVDYAITTDILELIDEDYQIEFLSVMSHNSAWAARVGYYRHWEDSDAVYPNGERRWEIGFRWRYFLVERAPNLLFFGLGFDNRPTDNTITPTAELGLNVCIRPVTVGVIGFLGYEFHWKDSDANRDVKGVELRAGICF